MHHMGTEKMVHGRMKQDLARNKSWIIGELDESSLGKTYAVQNSYCNTAPHHNNTQRGSCDKINVTDTKS
jgi:protein tyrosine/serine phosphatase